VTHWNSAQNPSDPPEAFKNPTSTGPVVDIVDVELDVALAVSGEANDLLHPRPDQVDVALAVSGEANDLLHPRPDQVVAVRAGPL
jgi:hypothetical protein